MDDDEIGTKVLSKKHPPNSILPQERIDTENQQLNEDGSKSEAPKFDEHEGTHRSEQAHHEEDSLLAVTPQPIEGKVERWNEVDEAFEEGFFIVLDSQQLTVIQGDSSYDQILHKFSFPHDAEYRFIEYPDLSEYEQNSTLQIKTLIIKDKTGQQIRLRFQDEKLYEGILMEWYSNSKLFSDFEKKPEEKSSDVFNESNYSFAINPLTSSQLGNIYNDNYMNAFQFYSIVMIYSQC